MVCDRVMYGGQLLLMVYHQSFDDEIKNRRLKIVEKVGNYNLVFTETLITDIEIDNITGWSAREEGLLTPDSTKNPYTGDVCASMVHYEYFIKPSKLFKFGEDKYVLNIPTDRLTRINDFIKKYTGVDIEQNPMLYGDILVFKRYSKNYYVNKSEGIIIENLPIGSTVIVHFKKNDVIVSTKVIRINHEIPETEIKTDKSWISHDIEIFIKDELVYYKKDISYMRSLILNTQIRGVEKRVKLNKIAESFIIERKNVSHMTRIGELPDQYEEIMHASAIEVKKRLVAEKNDEKVIFMKPGELQKAIDLIGNVMQAASDTIWIFDSYFTDSNDIKGMLDWIRILANCRAKSKNVVFYSKGPENALDIGKLKNEIENDRELNAILRVEKTLGVHFYQTKVPIHDRFVLTETANIISGLAMGTSFNSLDDHFYCIHKLNHKTSQTIWAELEKWMRKGNNLIKDEEM